MGERKSEDGNYSRSVSEVEHLVVRRINPDIGIDKDGCKYKDFMGSNPPCLSGSPNPIEIMNWNFKIEMVFEICNYIKKQKTVLTVRHLKLRVLSW